MFLFRVSELMSLRGHFDSLIGRGPQEHCKADDKPQKGKFHIDQRWRRPSAGTKTGKWVICNQALSPRRAAG